MMHRGPELGLIVFVGPTGDHNDRGMAGAAIMGAELGRRLDLTPTVIGTPQPATSASWATALPAALPGLREQQRSHRAVVERGDVPIATLPRCAASLATLPTIARHHPDAVVVWLDAHADLNTPDNLVLGGTRDLDAPERELVDAGTIALAAGPTLHTMLDQHVGDRPVYFHLDCDVLEPGTVPTDYRVPLGLTLDDLTAVSRRLSQNPIVGIEIAEFEAAADPADETDYAQPLLDALAPLLACVHTARL